MSDPAEALAKLYECEQSLEQLSRRQNELPGRIVGIEVSAQAARDLITAHRDALEDTEKRRREQEAALQDTEAQRDKFKGQTALVKTNEEYTALLSEIDTVTNRISQLEEEILLAMEAVDEVSGGLSDFRSGKEHAEREQTSLADELKRRLAEAEAELEAHEKEREHLAGELPDPAGASYLRMRKTGRSGTTTYRDRTCIACHRDIPYETINRVIGGELHSCPHCQRILVVPAG